VTVRIPVGGRFQRRCHSLSSTPLLDCKPRITVKRIEGGAVSTWICTRLRAGDELMVLPPAGHFVPRSFEGDFLLFAGGSGITPILSILRSVLVAGSSTIVLFYANRDEHSVIFRDELARLGAAYPGRLLILHWLESVQGPPSAEQIASLVQSWTRSEVFVCGPASFMATVGRAAAALGIESACVHVERFFSLRDGEEPVAVPSGAAEAERTAVRLRVAIDGTRHDLKWPRDVCLLDAMLAAGIDAPYSCRAGGCGACMCRLAKGEVHMVDNLVLGEREIGEGWVLACQATARSEEVEIEVPD
jgi:3-ketosteroid 9alpha-monooxygenase subunit B